jgi:hypothetical protein
MFNVAFESWLKRDHLMLLDHNPAVVGVASRPFWLFWATADGKRRSHKRSADETAPRQADVVIRQTTAAQVGSCVK